MAGLADESADILADLKAANRAHAERFPGDRPDRQPVHTVYGGAQLYKSTTTQRLGELALRSLETYAPDAFVFATALGLPGSDELPSSVEDRRWLAERFAADAEGVRRDSFGAWLAQTVYARVVEKLRREAVEDFRIDFEDGYGNRPDEEEDGDAERTARELAKAIEAGIAPPFAGIRIKPLNDELALRSVRTLDRFVTAFAEATGRAIPATFVVTLPKVPVAAQATALVRLFEKLESRLGLAAGTLKMELMIELTQTILDREGRSFLPVLLDACEGRCVAAHFGTYDFTASCSITAAYQTMDHPACDFAKQMMMMAYGGTGLFLSDGATNVMPVAPHRAGAGESLTMAQADENRRVVHNAWRLAYGHVRHSLEGGFYQGWDLHPAQLPVRYAACYAFFLEGFAAAAERLHNFMDKAAQATLVGDVFDDAATGQGLLNFFLRALNCGAVSLEELAVTGLTVDEIQTRSFVKILDGRAARSG